jgi:hypothetical protein
VSLEHDAFTLAIMLALHTGDQSALRALPEGRRFLLGIARDRRRIPLAVRRGPRVAGASMRATVDRIMVDVLRAPPCLNGYELAQRIDRCCRGAQCH